MRGIPLSKAYEASLAIYLAALLVSLGWDSFPVTLGLTIGTALAVGLLATWEFMVRRAFDPAQPSKLPLVTFGLLKLPFAGLVVYLVVGRGWANPLAFAAGLAVPQVALVVMAIGARTLGSKTLQRSEA